MLNEWEQEENLLESHERFECFSIVDMIISITNLDKGMAPCVVLINVNEIQPKYLANAIT